ncbi:MAG TPA: DUF559 domain-containing protein, partial [Xanthobacteraceae bacterium]|nr:DUF559 domain-containing protein [Xanthobacteraceae bacterium]
DKARSAYLKSRGYRVLRFWNNEVLKEIDGVMSVIYDAVHQQEMPPTPNPSPPLASGHPAAQAPRGPRRAGGGERRGRP